MNWASCDEFDTNLIHFNSTGGVGRPGLQGYPGQNVQGQKGNSVFFVHKPKVAHSTLQLFYFIGSSGSPGLPGPNGFTGDRYFLLKKQKLIYNIEIY